jgi:uncharacterized protein GlcG (DUF336 family)
MGIALAQAEQIIAAAKAKSVELDLKMNIAVVDAGANLVAFIRMDDAWLGLGYFDKKSQNSAVLRYADRQPRHVVAARQCALQHRTLQRWSHHISWRFADYGR